MSIWKRLLTMAGNNNFLYMPSIIILHPNDRREIRYEAKEGEKDGIDSRLVSLTPVELARIKLAKTIQEVQKELRRYI